MSVRFKFRSSVNFDSIDIGEGRSSISIKDLRYKILRQKNNNNICQDFDLVFSDALTGREYNDENFPIPSGSSVIIKRVPAGMVTTAPAVIESDGNCRMKDSKPLSPLGGQMDDFDDFGIDLCPAPEAMVPEFDQEFSKKNCVSNEKDNIAASRLECQKLEVSDLIEAIPRDSFRSANEVNIPQKFEPKAEEQMKLEKAIGANYSAVQNADLPSELKCPLCNAFFKEAVMIPCCQLSFCEKCIRVVLIDKGRCPKCFSNKCRVEDLLPNLSLRQAIERFLESQMLMTDNALHEYAPDGESGIQALDFSCAVTIGQKEFDLPHSSSATEKGSNQIMGGFFPESRIRKNASLESKALKLASSSHKVKQIDGEIQSGPQDLASVSDFQGENQPLNFARTRLHETAADSTVRKQSGLWVDNGGGRSFMSAGRHRMGDRTCYMCGSPDHLIRDCPAAYAHNPMLQTGNPMFPGGMLPGGMAGYGPPYWNGGSFAPTRPFTNMYGHPGMMPFNPAMLPVSPYAIPPHISSMYGGPPAPSGIMRMGGLAPPVGIRGERPVSHSELLELQECEKRGKPFDENVGRRRRYDAQDDFHQRHHYNEPEQSYDNKSRSEREETASHSGDSHSRRSRRKHQNDEHYVDHEILAVDERHGKSSRSSGRDRRHHLSERSSSGVEDIVSNSCDKYCDDGHEKHHRSSKRHHERRGQCGSDSSRSHHKSRKENDAQRRVDSVSKVSNRKHHSHSESVLEPSSSCDQEKKYRDRHHVRGFGPISNEPCGDRWQMVSRLDDDSPEGSHHHKRKRTF
ncbi:hypothetical protein LguiB_009625 [Lonicera macranthoides]